MSIRAHSWITLLFIAAITLAVYARVWRFEFVNYDDDEYITKNPWVANGLNLRSIAWAFSAAHAANYHPLTWMSLQLDASLFGLRPGLFHIENVLLHALNSMLLFVFLKMATGDHWPSVFCAIIFSVHPAHVESVAWIAERKDVLSTLFLLLAMLAYVRCTRGGGRPAHVWMLLCFLLSLLSKQMGVTLPATLLLLDFWPLRRGDAGVKKLIIEKFPLMLLALTAAVAVFLAQHSGGAVVQSIHLPLNIRLQNVPIAYVRYACEMIWPVDLCIFYPYRYDWPLIDVVGSLAMLLLVTVICHRARQRQPWLIAGWLWFLVMMLPVIGIIQIGSASLADRYLYLPSVGLTLMLAWWSRHQLIARDTRFRRNIIWTGATVMVCLLALAAHLQTTYWQNSHMLRSHTIVILNDPENACMQLAQLDLKEGEPNSAAREYEQAIHIAPQDFTPEFEFANMLSENPPLAVQHYQRAMQLAPRNAKVANNLGVAYLRQAKSDLAEKAFHEAVADDRLYSDPHLNLGKMLESRGEVDHARGEYQEALRIDPNNNAAAAAVQRLR